MDGRITQEEEYYLMTVVVEKISSVSQLIVILTDQQFPRTPPTPPLTLTPYWLAVPLYGVSTLQLFISGRYHVRCAIEASVMRTIVCSSSRPRSHCQLASTSSSQPVSVGHMRPLVRQFQGHRCVHNKISCYQQCWKLRNTSSPSMGWKNIYAMLKRFF